MPYDLTCKWNLMNKTKNQNRVRGTKTQNRMTAVRGEAEGGDWLKEGEGASQRTYLHDPWTWAPMM